MVNKSSDVVYGEDLCLETTFQQGKKREACGLTENKVMELQLLFLFRHLAQFRDIFPYKLQTSWCWICVKELSCPQPDTKVSAKRVSRSIIWS